MEVSGITLSLGLTVHTLDDCWQLADDFAAKEANEMYKIFLLFLLVAKSFSNRNLSSFSSLKHISCDL
jgi:hypothetical protein